MNKPSSLTRTGSLRSAVFPPRYECLTALTLALSQPVQPAYAYRRPGLVPVGHAHQRTSLPAQSARHVVPVDFGGADSCALEALHISGRTVSTLHPVSGFMNKLARLGYLIFGDVPDAAMIVGAAVIVGSGLYAFHRERIRNREMLVAAKASAPPTEGV